MKPSSKSKRRRSGVTTYKGPGALKSVSDHLKPVTGKSYARGGKRAVQGARRGYSRRKRLLMSARAMRHGTRVDAALSAFINNKCPPAEYKGLPPEAKALYDKIVHMGWTPVSAQISAAWTEGKVTSKIDVIARGRPHKSVKREQFIVLEIKAPSTPRTVYLDKYATECGTPKFFRWLGKPILNTLRNRHLFQVYSGQQALRETYSLEYLPYGCVLIVFKGTRNAKDVCAFLSESTHVSPKQ